MFDSFVDSLFAADNNPFLARLFKFWQAGRCKMYDFGITATWLPLTASQANALPGTAPVIDGDTDFLVVLQNFVAYPTTGNQWLAQSNPNMTVNVLEKTGSQLWSDAAMHVGTWFGSTGLQGQSFWLPIPRRLVGPNTLQIQLTDNGGTATNCYMSFLGVKVEYLDIERNVVWGPVE